MQPHQFNPLPTDVPTLAAGIKVLLKGSENCGFAEIATCDGDHCEILFFTSPVSFQKHRCPSQDVRRGVLPAQTRCFRNTEGECHFGRVIAEGPQSEPIRSYFVMFPNQKTPVLLDESDFHVRSYLPANDPLQVLASLANETPFFFDFRTNLFRELLRQRQLSHGLTGLLSSKIDLLPHQIQLSAIILKDTTVRYLLADEVGLGKTIEAGIVLRQLRLDTPQIKMVALVPDQLVRQWRDELDRRFDLPNVQIIGHGTFLTEDAPIPHWDLVVIDEAHRIVSASNTGSDATNPRVTELCNNTKHLLLLSATPVLHHDHELLKLLQLLDPENYTNVTAEAFKERTKRRTELGRAFLALRNASITPLVKLNAKKLAEIMPDDDVLQKFLREITSDGADVKRIQQEIHFHISETYRIHRRMLRTRRRWITELDAHYLRSVKENADTELDESPYIACWQILEDWRTETAARVGNDDAIASICAKQYTALAQAISADPESLPQIVEETLNSTAAAPTETELLEKLVDPRQADAMIKARASLIRDILKERLARDGNGSKCVVFCASTEICQLVVKLCSQTFPKSWVCIADKSTDKNKASATFSDFAINDARVLVTDSVGEEGFNLQYSKAVIFQDLPWSPMRIEQRIGRFDRIEKQGRIICHTITSGEDESLCLDEIWRRVLTEGFGIFTQSISDLQNIVEAIIPHLQQVAFFGGPNSLLAEIPNLKTRISSERDAIEEQDVIDGMHTLSPNSPLCKDVKLADAEAEHFGTALIDYVHNNIGLIPQWNEENNSLSFELQRSASPIIPADRFDALSRMLHKPSTFYREVAIESLGLQFLRPGHIAVDACLNLLAWDDRGRSFAMWRHVPTIEHPRVVFRCIVLAHAEVEPIRQKLASTIATPQGSGALIRMASGWFPDNVSELFFDEQGQPVLDSISAICKSPYNKDTDLNLGKDRAAFVREQFGIHTWRTWCEAVASSAINNVASSQELHKKRDSAIAQASEHFALMRARLNSRQRAGIESQDQVEQSRIALKEVEEAIRTALANPKLRLDSIGAYILSAKPFWEQSL